jgi:polynucleotide 5'-kinase involved in rRNA processing
LLVLEGSASGASPARLKEYAKAESIVIVGVVEYEHALVALNDASMNVLGLGLITAFRPAEGRAEVLCAPEVVRKVRSMTLGDTRVLPSGQELPKGGRFRYV